MNVISHVQQINHSCRYILVISVAIFFQYFSEFFSNRIANMWNSLPDYVVMSDTINSFKNRLNAHWKHRDFLFHYRATYTVTGD